MAEIHAARRGRAQDKIIEVGADAALITSGPNVRYLTGLASSNAALLLAADGTAVLATDSRYTLAAQRELAGLIKTAGWSAVRWRNLSLGAVAVHVARRA